MTTKLPKLIATSVVRGSQQGESHGGIYAIDFGNQTGGQHVDWNKSNIDFEGRGAVLNDRASDHVRFVSRDGDQQAYKIATHYEADIEFAGIDDSKIARQGFGRGLCVAGERFVAAESSPSTIALYDMEARTKLTLMTSKRFLHQFCRNVVKNKDDAILSAFVHD